MVKVYTMVKEDISEVLKISAESFGSMSWTERDFHNAIESEYDYPLVLKDDDLVIAFSLLRKLGPESEVQEICVTREYRRRGHADKLMDLMIEKARTDSGSSVFLEVREGNYEAIALYEKKGFIRLYTRENYYRDPIEAAIVMRLDLSNPK